MEKWIPIEFDGIPNIRYQIVSILDDEVGLSIILMHNDMSECYINILFEGDVQAYQIMQERYRLKLYDRLSVNYGGGFYSDKTFFKVEDSEYLNWCSSQSEGISEYEKVSHYSIFTDDVVIDIVTDKVPKVTQTQGTGSTVRH